MKEKFITLKELLAENDGDYLSYQELLCTKEWRDFRKVILKRDNHQCQKCHRKGNFLAWEMKKDGITIYVRQSDEIERKFLSDDLIYSSKHIELHVHHKYYINDHYPWQYEDEALITVCMECHEKIHKTEEITVYVSIDNKKILPTKRCSRCNAKGYLNEYKYHMRGICFSCEGKGYKIL